MSVVGLDPIQGYYRFTFDNPELFGGIEVIPVLLGGFAIPQVLSVMRVNIPRTPVPSSVTRIIPPWSLWLHKWKTIVRSGLVGVWVGSIPGVGEDVAAWMSYDVAKRTSKTPEKFGTGIEEGVIAPETANNSCIGGAIIPLLTLGVPGSPPAAMLLGAIWLHGVRPGPMLSFEFPNFIPQMAATLFWASAAMLIMGLCMSKVTVQILKTPPALFMPIVTFFCVLGSYALGLRIFNLYLMVAFGVLAYFLEEMGYPIAPLVIGMILGPMVDENLRRALIGSKGSLLPFVTRPIAIVLLLLILYALVSQTAWYRRWRGKEQRIAEMTEQPI
jgi:putative tricarboxylic transport membrane protein